MSDDRDPGTPFSRRDALKALALVPIAGALHLEGGVVERAARAVRALDEGDGQQQAYRPKFFTAHEWRTVRVLVDDIIPRDARSGSATDAKVPEYMDFFMADSETSEGNRTAMRGGLAWLDLECGRRFGGATFAVASEAQRHQLLDDIAWPKKARPEFSPGVAFFNRMRDMTASGFFSSATGWKDLQYMGHVFVPEWNGCPPAALDKLGVSYDLMKSVVPPQK